MVALLEESKQLSQDVAGVLYQYVNLFQESEDIALQRMHRATSIEKIQDSMADMDSDSRLRAIESITSLYQLDAKDVTQIRQYRLALKSFMVEFGLTPAARSRVKQIEEPKHAVPTSPFARLQGEAAKLRRVK